MISQSTSRVIVAWMPVALWSVAGMTASAPAQSPPNYSVQFITPGLDAINAAAMNQAGDVVGTTQYARAWVSHAGAPAILLPLAPGKPYSYANDISDTGVIVGSVSFGQYSWMGIAAAWFPDGSGGYGIVEFGTLPGHVGSNALAVNNVGDIVGFSSNGTFRIPVLFTPQGIVSLQDTGIFDPVAVNDQRQVIDHSFTCKRLDLDTMVVEDLGTPPDPGSGQTGYLASRGEAINEAGQVAGAAILATSTNCDHQAARHTDGVGWEVFSMCGSFNSARDINDQGDIIMQLNVAPYVRYEGIGTFLIEDRIVADVGHWFVINGYGLAINNARQLAVPAHNQATDEAGIVLLTPIAVAGDINGDNTVDVDDLLAVINAWGECNGACPADIAPAPDGDGAVDVNDLLMVINNWS